MKENVKKIPANTTEITLYCHLGEALIKTQAVEQALSHSITLKMNPDETKEIADEFLKKSQKYTLGQAVNIAKEKKLCNSALQEELDSFLKQRNWLVHSVLIGNEEDFNAGNIKEALFQKIKSISDKAESIQHLIEYDMIDFCSSKGRDMSKIKELLQLQERGIRVRKSLN
ncbi:hypothetical protein NHF50_00860 [Flavobacterium sp. NRK F10]|uniref:hypothetical protein n=1 Tax=Flavobacterium sp. NRK F10 TaxID=2954931 RepID=UPI002091189B|nr:hypothetical protein [Flavobacterium sp. NRK F10]MCO6173585.1 hypothetical protein [Flavobacterium sp. NRK F10]